MFLRANIDMNTLHIFWMIFWMNTKCNWRSWLKTFFVFLNGKAGDVEFYFPLSKPISTWKSGHKCIFFFYCSIGQSLFHLQLILLIFHGHIWMEGRIIHVQSWNYYSVGRQKIFQGLFFNLLLPLFAELVVPHVWASAINSYLFSRPTMYSPLYSLF